MFYLFQYSSIPVSNIPFSVFLFTFFNIPEF